MDSNSEHHPKLSPVRAFQALHGNNSCNNEEELYTSLSEYHDYEPCLEFDDTELIHTAGLAPLPPELLDMGMLHRTSSDGTIEENFEEELGTVGAMASSTAYAEICNNAALEESFEELNLTGMLEVIGDDEIGRRIIVVSACRLPDGLPHDKLLRYLMFTLDKYVEQDYSLVYFHFGLTKANRPPLSWLWKAYKAFDRKYKKNLKALYLVHPTTFIRFVFQMLRPVISAKFGRKMMYVNYLHELLQHIKLDPFHIPPAVRENDRILLQKDPRAAAIANRQFLHPVSPIPSASLRPPHATQFGVSLYFIIMFNPGIKDGIPPVVRQCVEFLSQPDALETEGLFRRSANVTTIKQLQRASNRNEILNFENNPHNAAVLLKTFLRELEEPLLTYELYMDILELGLGARRDKEREIKVMILENLPLENYKVLKYIMKFLWKVQDRSCLNKMTSSNLAVVFGPNLAWPSDGQMSLQSIAPINAFIDYLLENQEHIFIV